MALSFGAAAAHAHGTGTSQLRLGLTGARFEGEWEVHLRDARLALGLAADVTGDVAFSEVSVSTIVAFPRRTPHVQLRNAA